MNILEQITAQKKAEVKRRKEHIPIRVLERAPLFRRKAFPASEFIKSGSGIIAEFKRQSPSKGVIHPNPNIETITKGYVSAGASAISVLTDKEFFGGSDADLMSARSLNSVPILRKDFMVDEYQILESKALGADMVLLIAACLTPKEISRFGRLAHSVNMEVLLEVRDKEELQRSLCPSINLIGVNNRDLTTFEVDVQRSYDLVNEIPDEFLKISESGISNPKTIIELREAGFNGFLIGEHFMQAHEPEKACEAFIDEIA